MPASEETNENRPVIIATNVLFKTVRRYLLGVVPSKIPCTAVFFRVLYVRGLSAMAPLTGGSFLTPLYGNGATKFDGLSDIPTIPNFSEISAKH